MRACVCLCRVRVGGGERDEMVARWEGEDERRATVSEEERGRHESMCVWRETEGNRACVHGETAQDGKASPDEPRHLRSQQLVLLFFFPQQLVLLLLLNLAHVCLWVCAGGGGGGGGAYGSPSKHQLTLGDRVTVSDEPSVKLPRQLYTC